MFYGKARKDGYVSVYHFRLEHFLFDNCIFLTENFTFCKVLSYRKTNRTDMLNKYKVLKLKNNCLNNRDFNIEQNNRDYDCSHNGASLGTGRSLIDALLMALKLRPVKGCQVLSNVFFCGFALQLKSRFLAAQIQIEELRSRLTATETQVRRAPPPEPPTSV